MLLSGTWNTSGHRMAGAGHAGSGTRRSRWSLRATGPGFSPRGNAFQPRRSIQRDLVATLGHSSHRVTHAALVSIQRGYADDFCSD